MFSKHNEKVPKKEREYFDNPIGFHKQGHQFYSIHKKPIEIAGGMGVTGRSSLKSAGMNSVHASALGYRSQSTSTSLARTFGSGFGF